MWTSPSPPGAGCPVSISSAPAAYDRLGIWFRTGDIDGDGTADILVGADQSDRGAAANAGSGWVIRGGAHLAVTGTVDLADFGATMIQGALIRIDPPAGSAGFHLGGTVQCGDLDSNGRAEVMLAATIHRAGAALVRPGTPAGAAAWTGGAPRGRLYIVWDDLFPAAPWPPGHTIDLGLAPSNSLSEVRGHTDNLHFAEEIVGGDDWDGDGRADLFCGDLSGTSSNGINAGLGFVFFDAARLRGRTIDLAAALPARTTRIEGPQGGAIGNDTAASGDFDGDGLDDLFLGNPHDHPESRINAGSVHLLYGQRGDWPAHIDLAPGALPPPDQLRVGKLTGRFGADGLDRGDTLCYSAAAADLDGDGRDDFIVNEMIGNAPGANDVGNMLFVSGRQLLPPPPVVTSLVLSAPDPTRLGLEFDPDRYVLQWSDPVLPMQWHDAQTNDLTASDTEVLRDPPDPAPARFYRFRFAR